VGWVERSARRGLALLTAALRWLTGLEWLAAVVAAPLLTFPTVRPRWTAAVLAVLVALWLLRLLVRREPWPLTPFNTALLLFALMIPVALWVSPVPEITVPETARVLLGLIAFRAAALAVRDRRTMAMAVLLFCLLGLLITAVGLLGAQWSGKVAFLRALGEAVPHLITALPEDQGTPGVNPNHLAGVLTLYLPLALALVLGWPLRRRASLGSALLLPLCLAFLLLLGGALLLTQSRSGWIGGAAGVVALVTLAGLTARHRWARVLGVAFPLLLVAVLVGAAFHLGPGRVAALLGATGAGEGLETPLGTVSLSGRLEIWSRALYAIQDFPFTGCGLGAFRRVVHVLYPLFLTGPDTDVGHAHNIFLQTALDVGLPGLVAYLALLLVAGAVCWRWARTGGPLARPLALGLAAGLVGLHAYGLTDALALGSKPVVAFWFALGLVAGLERAREAPLARARGEAAQAGLQPRQPPWVVAAVAVGLVGLLAGGVWWAWTEEGPGQLSPAPSLRLPLYPAAQGVNVRSENPPADSDWVGLWEVATFTTTHSLTDVVAFYTTALAAEGWTAQSQAGDATGWGGIYQRDGGRQVCLLDLFDMDGEVWVSVLCGDRDD